MGGGGHSSSKPACPAEGTNMTIRVGTLVTRYFEPNQDIPCKEHIDWERHAEADTDGITDICVGMVIDVNPDIPRVSVRWLQRCPFMTKRDNPAQEDVDVDNLWEIGQLR